jgi:hypothetical protein
MIMIKKVLLVIVLLLVLIQFIHPAKNESSAPTPMSLKAHYPLPDSVAAILEIACNDCHTNHSRYPWYDRIQPVTWFVNYHISGGKRHLNFDEFAGYPVKRQVKRLKDIVKTVQDGTMPLHSYTLAHKNAILTAVQKQLLCDWADGLRKQITDTTKI